ncbi:MAG: AI-2E family transporter [Aestuariivirga sp.]|uniref:AI-2E family transporter n=1 Tax=Aestuariivirga sp. TaxID=2650926 RepID=UPI0025C5103A|nr:AI-2E family transporter [Aestuariivirga sp.]MCA3561106.1 AI-2E family transporter [Aestuariivirga sp.]
MQEPDDARPATAGTASLMEKFALLLLFSLLLAGVYLVLKPFMLGLAFGAILAVAAWPLRTWLVGKGLPGAVAAGLMLTLLLVFVLVPVALMAPGLALGVKQLAEQGMDWISAAPQLPGWLTGLPLAGVKIAETWNGLLAQTPETKAMLMSYIQPLRQFLTEAALGLAASILDISVALIVATSFWARGDRIAAVLRDSLARLGGPQLAALTGVAAGATRGVFYGIVGTAAVQGLLMAVGLLIAGVPGAAALGFVTLIFAISQLGAVLINVVWAGAAWWIYSTSGMGAGFWFVVGWGLMVTVSDNLLKPLLIGSSLKLPLMLVILGVFGGFVSFGFLGLFIGPTLLAVAFELLAAWRQSKAAPVDRQGGTAGRPARTGEPAA